VPRLRRLSNTDLQLPGRPVTALAVWVSTAVVWPAVWASISSELCWASQGRASPARS